MRADDLVLARGLRDTGAAVERWRAGGWRVIAGWAGVSALVAAGLLLSVWAVAEASRPDPTPLHLAGVTRPVRAGDLAAILVGNGLVLALHALACVAGFIARSSLPEVARGRSGLSRRVHELAGPVAIAWVLAATLFSLATQAWVLGDAAATLAAQLGMSPALLLAATLPHALPELVALFLPLAAWTLAGRRGRWDELLAATLVTVAVAAPVLLVSALVELTLFPALVLALSG